MILSQYEEWDKNVMDKAEIMFLIFTLPSIYFTYAG